MEFQWLRNRISQFQACACVVYRVTDPTTAGGLRAVLTYWSEGNSATPEQQQRVLRNVGLWCYQNDRDRVYRSPIPGVPEPDRRWWALVAGSGPVRRAGYVIVVVLPATEEAEVRRHISTIHQDMGRHGFSGDAEAAG